MPEARAGAIDIGTNTVLLLAATGTRAHPVALMERATITRLGQGVDRTRRLSQEGIARTLECLESYAALFAELGVRRVAAVCTSAARDSVNGPQFLDLAARALGSRPKIVDGLEEARLVFEGALIGLNVDGPVTVFDIGGGSTEVIRGRREDDRGVIERSVSIDIGSVRLSERHVHHDPPLREEIDAMQRDIDDALATPLLDGAPALVGVAGTMTTLAAIDQRLSSYDSARVHGASLPAKRIAEICEDLERLPLASRKEIPGLEPGRADVIVAGALIAKRIVVRANARDVIVSDRGVRWGLVQGLLP